MGNLIGGGEMDMKSDKWEQLDELFDSAWILLKQFEFRLQPLISLSQVVGAELQVKKMEHFNLIKTQVNATLERVKALHLQLKKTKQSGQLEGVQELSETLMELVAICQQYQSSFLTFHLKAFLGIVDKLKQLSAPDGVEGGTVGASIALEDDCPRLYIALYQLDGHKIEVWPDNIRVSINNLSGKIIYSQEKDIEQLMRSKQGAKENNGYLVVKVKAGDYAVADGKQDKFGQQLFTIKRNAVELSEVEEFVQGNGKRYRLVNKQLVLIPETQLNGE